MRALTQGTSSTKHCLALFGYLGSSFLEATAVQLRTRLTRLWQLSTPSPQTSYTALGRSLTVAFVRSPASRKMVLGLLTSLRVLRYLLLVRQGVRSSSFRSFDKNLQRNDLTLRRTRLLMLSTSYRVCLDRKNSPNISGSIKDLLLMPHQQLSTSTLLNRLVISISGESHG
jgi:hypothetical protein